MCGNIRITIKIGHYDQELGGLDSPTTNQRLYKIEHQGDGSYKQVDITSSFWKKMGKVNIKDGTGCCGCLYVLVMFWLIAITVIGGYKIFTWILNL